MSGFTKLVPEIIQSSIWNESAEVRIVWITLLAIKDEEGNVRGNIKTLARMANVRDKSAEDAIEKFKKPDPDSNTPAMEGRRIESIPGGWHVINHSVYRAKDYKDHEAERKREYRKRVSGTSPGQVPDSSASASVSASSLDQDKRGMQGGGIEYSFDSIPAIVNAILSSRPEFKNKLNRMTVENIVTSCPADVREKTFRDYVENVANMLQPPDSPISLLKGYARKGATTSSIQPIETNKERMDRLNREMRGIK